MNYRIVNGRVYDTGLNNDLNRTLNTTVGKRSNNSFEKILKEKLTSANKDGFKISNHAVERLKYIGLDSADHKKIQSGFDKLREKGARNAVMLYKDMAFVASIENNTIITVVEESRAKDNVFTNIDSLVIL